MHLEQARAEINAIECQMSPSIFKFILRRSKSRIKHTLAALRLTGFRSEADSLPCSFCGSTLTIETAHPVLRDGVPVPICEDCCRKTALEEL